ncbi:hypothetical protein MTR_2g098230 [Medicago truncatula]|uniref:Uncharacterized protein n=1 Tax=Medicago truncatula TaxID=3880 RepID=G7IUD8_MEDTR|nr:hypothetical protein MTR_2g098230 [Medicago truncatula]
MASRIPRCIVDGSKHEAGNDWLQNGNCPIAKSYQAVSKVLPLVAKVIQPPAGMKYKCPHVIVEVEAVATQSIKLLIIINSFSMVMWEEGGEGGGGGGRVGATNGVEGSLLLGGGGERK